MRYDLLQLIKDECPILEKNATLKALVYEFIKDKYTKVKKLGTDNLKYLSSDNPEEEYTLDYYDISKVDYIVEISKGIIGSREIKELVFHTKNENEFSIVYHSYEENENNKYLETYKLDFFKNKIIKSQVGMWKYDKKIQDADELINSLLDDYNPIKYDFNMFKNLQDELYCRDRILPDYFLTMELNSVNNKGNANFDGENISIDIDEETDILKLINGTLKIYDETDFFDNKDTLSMSNTLTTIKKTIENQKDKKLIKTEEKKVKDALKFYLQTIKLVDTVRSGWDEKHWNVKKERLESVAEHTYKSIMLAIAMHSEYDYRHIDLNKVIAMLAVHELGETKIGDITYADGVSASSKKEQELRAYKEILAPLTDKEYILNLFIEFEARETLEAKFAYLCDKGDCDIMAKFYEDYGYNHLDGQENNPAYNSERVQEILKDGFNTVADCFIEYDVPKYKDDDNFMKVLRYVQKHDIKKIGD